MLYFLQRIAFFAGKRGFFVVKESKTLIFLGSHFYFQTSEPNPKTLAVLLEVTY